MTLDTLCESRGEIISVGQCGAQCTMLCQCKILLQLVFKNIMQQIQIQLNCLHVAVCTRVFPLLVKINRRTVRRSCDTKKQRKNCINKLLHYCLLTEGQQYSEKSVCICVLQATLLISIRCIKFTRQNLKQNSSNHINTNENFSREKETLKNTCSVCSSWQQQHTSPHRTCTLAP